MRTVLRAKRKNDGEKKLHGGIAAEREQKCVYMKLCVYACLKHTLYAIHWIGKNS